MTTKVSCKGESCPTMLMVCFICPTAAAAGVITRKIGGSLPGLFSGALITETLFFIRGIGYASYTSMTQADIPFIMFYLAFISILTLLGNLISDLLYAAADPRVRLS